MNAVANPASGTTYVYTAAPTTGGLPAGVSFTASTRVLAVSNTVAVTTDPIALSYVAIPSTGSVVRDSNGFMLTITAGMCTAMQTGTFPNCMDPAPPPDMMQPPDPTSTVARKKDDNDDFEKVAYSAGVAIVGSVIWNYYRNRNPSFGKQFEFQAKPTSNKSLQYSLQTNLNESWVANFTVDKTVKINSETNNSNLYKLKFEYKF